jgi:hypothetical protein
MPYHLPRRQFVARAATTGTWLTTATRCRSADGKGEVLEVPTGGARGNLKGYLG